MCGIFGYSFKNGRLSPARRAVLATNLARYNDERGGDSWGIMALDRGQARVIRGIGDLSDNAYELCNYNTLFAHTRWATHGKPTIRNAHPFKIGKILGAHNGQIRNHEQLNKKYGRNFEVDSMHIFAHINEGRELKELEGYGAIQWIRRSDPSKIYISKLLNGELAAYAVSAGEKPDGVIWSSSYKHALKSMLAAGITDFARYHIRQGKVYSIVNGVFAVEDMKCEISHPHIDKPTEDEIEESQSNEATSVEYRTPRNAYHERRIDDFRMYRFLYGGVDL